MVAAERALKRKQERKERDLYMNHSGKSPIILFPGMDVKAMPR